MRIVTVVNSLNAGGAEGGLLKLIEATRDRFEHVVVPLISGGVLTPRFRELGIPLVEGGLKRGALPVRGVPDLMRRIFAYKPDVLVGRMYHSALAATVSQQLSLKRVPMIWTIHHSLDGWKDNDGRSTRLAVRACRVLSHIPRAIVYVSARAAEHHFAFGFSRRRGVVIPNGYNLERFRPDQGARARLRAEWGFDEEDIVVGHAARVHPSKAHASFLEAVARASTQQPRLAAVLCGLDTERLEVPAAIRGRVRLLGRRTDMPAIMSAVDFGCLSSTSSDAFPNVVAEFLCCARPCVTTDVGDAAMIVDRFGRVVPPRQPEQLAAALTEMALMPAAERSALGAAGRQSIQTRFDMAAIAERHAQLWEAARDGRR